MGIDTPRHIFVNRDGYRSSQKGEQKDNEEDVKREPVMIECDDHIEVDGVVLHKPFVEKPVDAEGKETSRGLFPL